MGLKLKNTHARIVPVTCLRTGQIEMSQRARANRTTHQSGAFFLTITMHRFYTSTQTLQSPDNSVIYFYTYSVRMVLFIQATIPTSLQLNWASLVYCQ